MELEEVLQRYFDYLCEDLVIMDRDYFYTFKLKWTQVHVLRYGNIAISPSERIPGDKFFLSHRFINHIALSLSISEKNVKLRLILWMEEQIQKDKDGGIK